MRARATSRALLLRAQPKPRAQSLAIPVHLSKSFFSPSRQAAQIRNTLSDVVEFEGSRTRLSPEEVGLSGPGGQGPDERTVKLGKTLRILQSRLPSLLASPLPTEILSPHISLHLFPSTHPHLPTVSGRVAYQAALWTSPITWGRVPLIGNVKLVISSERIVRNGPSYHNSSPISGNQNGGRPLGEQLIVRWKTCARTQNGSRPVLGKMTEWLGRNEGENGDFSGLFIFEFDEDGRVLSHTIERAEQSGNWDQGVGKFVGLTDWLLGRLERREQLQPGLAVSYIRNSRRPDKRGRDEG